MIDTNDWSPDENRYDGRMQYRRCGRSGLMLPEISLGHWHNFGGDSSTDEQRRMIYSAFDLGITHFDSGQQLWPTAGICGKQYRQNTEGSAP